LAAFRRGGHALSLLLWSAPAWAGGPIFTVNSLAAQPLATELVLNGGAEGNELGEAVSNSYPIDTPYWIQDASPEMTQVLYGSQYFPAKSDAPPESGSFFFTGRTSELAMLSRPIDVSAVAAQIDAGAIGYAASGAFGGQDADFCGEPERLVQRRRRAVAASDDWRFHPRRPRQRDAPDAGFCEGHSAAGHARSRGETRSSIATFPAAHALKRTARAPREQRAARALEGSTRRVEVR